VVGGKEWVDIGGRGRYNWDSASPRTLFDEHYKRIGEVAPDGKRAMAAHHEAEIAVGSNEFQADVLRMRLSWIEDQIEAVRGRIAWEGPMHARYDVDAVTALSENGLRLIGLCEARNSVSRLIRELEPREPDVQMCAEVPQPKPSLWRRLWLGLFFK
jgi:hypothetical protein